MNTDGRRGHHLRLHQQRAGRLLISTPETASWSRRLNREISMRLYHFTGAEMLRGIAKCGLTVGDVPTDLRTMSGRIGVWFSDISEADGHGLEQSAVNKKRMRLTVDLPPDLPALVRWRSWAPANVSADTIAALEKAGGEAAESWWIFFGWVKPEWVVAVHDMEGGQQMLEWQTAFPEETSRAGIPYWRRETWQKKMLKDVRRVQQARQR